jgi:hypothetical protein
MVQGVGAVGFGTGGLTRLGRFGSSFPVEACDDVLDEAFERGFRILGSVVVVLHSWA